MHRERRYTPAGLIPAAAAALATALWTSPCAPAEPASDELPKWEIGLVGAGGWTPHYPAADQSGGAVAAAPYLKYRGRRLRLGDDGLVSGRILKTDRIDITTSLAGSLPASSDDNDARDGMPDLDALFEIGPQFVVYLGKQPESETLSLKLPIRIVASTDFSNLTYRGVIFHPRLSYHRDTLFQSENLSGTASFGPIFASEPLMEYFYEVAPQYATPERPPYEVHGGYLGSTFGLGLSYQISKQFSISIGAEFGYYDRATNEDSPLHRSDTGVKAGAGIVWTAWTSKSTVPD
ncbi:MAG: MipA/OmpV family protein [Alphaproteobacteria bacterium]|nr:MipA/OmpV family protein [Alphaproteobacteria bacterium]